MSICNIFLSKDTAYTVSDTAIYDSDFSVYRFDQKVFDIEGSWTGVVAGRGSVGAQSRISELAAYYKTFSSFLENSAEDIQAEYEEAKLQTLTMYGDDHSNSVLALSAFVIGWHDITNRPEAYVIMSPEVSGNIEPFTWVPLEGDFYVAHAPNRAGLWRLHRQGCQPGVDYVGATFDPAAHALPLAEVQRRTHADAAYNPLATDVASVVGGDLILTTLTKDGVRHDTIHSWPDELDRRINPGAYPIPDSDLPRIPPAELSPEHHAKFWELYDGGLIDPVNLTPLAPKAGMNRKDRRRMEKAKRNTRVRF